MIHSYVHNTRLLFYYVKFFLRFCFYYVLDIVAACEVLQKHTPANGES